MYYTFKDNKKAMIYNNNYVLTLSLGKSVDMHRSKDNYAHVCVWVVILPINIKMLPANFVKPTIYM